MISYKLNQIFEIAMDENKTFAAKGKKCWLFVDFLLEISLFVCNSLLCIINFSSHIKTLTFRKQCANAPGAAGAVWPLPAGARLQE